MEQRIIKSVVKTNCPHCQKTIFIPIAFASPLVTALLSDDDIKQAKATAREKIIAGTLSDEQKDRMIKTINEPNMIFSLEDVDAVIESIKD